MSTGGYQWDFSIVVRNSHALLQGLGLTLIITAYSIFIGSLAGAVVAYAKGSRTRLIRVIANAFTDAFRAIPVLVMMIWLFYSFPSITLFLGFESPIRLGPEMASIAALSVYLAAQVADILRAGLDSIPDGQYEVAHSLGLGTAQIVRYIQIPQVVLLTLPAILGQYASTLLLSSLASVIAVGELLHQAQEIITNQYHALEVYTTVAALYLCVAWPVTYLAKRLSHRSFAHAEAPSETVAIKTDVPRREPTLALQVRSLGLRTKSGTAILNDIDFDLAPGAVLGVFGPSGAGKSSLVRILAGLIPATEGSCIWRDGDGHEGQPRNLGYVPQGLFLWPHLTARQNVALSLKVAGKTKRADALRIADHWLDELDLGHRRNAKPVTLSGGEAQRVAIARALAVNPEIFLLDEITSSLDPELISQVVDALAAIVRSGATVVIVSHNYGSIYSLIDSAIFIDKGRQLDFGDKEAVFTGRIPRVRAFLSRHAESKILPPMEISSS